jgi:hypothetical protein
MQNKKLIQILLPLYDKEGKNFPAGFYTEIRKTLTEKFGGLTAYSRAPATGLWKENSEKVSRDDIIVYEVMVEHADEEWWNTYKKELELRFRQDELLIRSTDITLF